MEALTLLVALAALAVSGVALYLTSLRPGEVVVDVVEDLSEPQMSGEIVNGRPKPTKLVARFHSGTQARRAQSCKGPAS